MKAVVLVGGQGTRLRPLTSTTPKQMLPVAGRPMIERVLSHLASHGVDEVVLSLGYRPDAFLAAYGDGVCAGVRLRYAVEPQPRDTAGGIAFAARSAGLDETFLVHNGDVLTGLDVTALVAFHRSRSGAATISLTPVEEPWRFGVVESAPSGQVTAFIEKPPEGTDCSRLINAGTYVLDPEVLDQIPPDRPVSIERQVFPALVAEGTLYALASYADWKDAGTVVTYLQANLDLAREEQRWVDPSAQVDPTAQVDGSRVEPHAGVGPRAQVAGSLVMAGAHIGPDAVVRDSIIGPGAVIGEGALVEGLSIVGGAMAVDAGSVVSGRLIPTPGP